MLTTTVVEKKLESELLEVVALKDSLTADQTEANVQPMCTDGSSLNATAGSMDKDDSSLRTVAAATEAKSAERKQHKIRTRRRKQANVLVFQFKSGHKPINVILRGKKLSSLLSNKNTVSVVGAKFSHLKLLPTGAFIAPRFTLSLVHLRSRTDDHQDHRRFTMCGSNVPIHGQWMETERTRLMNQRNSIRTPSACVQQLQKKLTEELDSAAAMDVCAESDLSLEHLPQNNSLLSNEQTVKQETSILDEIDDIFGALDD